MSFAEVIPRDIIRLNVFTDGTISTTIRIKNQINAKLAFKVKANSRDRYDVSPAQGIILSESQVTIEISLKAQIDETAIDQDIFMISVIKMEGFPEVNDNRSIWNYFNKIAGACEHIDIKRKVTINENLRAEIDRMKKDLDQKEVFINKLINDRKGNIEQILRMNHHIVMNERSNNLSYKLIAAIILIIILSVSIKMFLML